MQHFVDHHLIVISYSGGSDSDIMLDLIDRTIAAYPDLIGKDKIDYHYVFFDTGLELEATKRHVKEVEERYGIKIDIRRPKVPIPLALQKDGYPFLSKKDSVCIGQMQKHNAAFKTNEHYSFKTDEKYWNSNIVDSVSRHKNLKDYMIRFPPNFPISDKCCKNAKKDTSKAYCKDVNADLVCMGMRQAEGGQRATSIVSCFEEGKNGKIDKFMPIWWFTDKDKAEYKAFYGLRYSDAYEVYGLKRTGCAGCPFNSKWEQELAVLDQYEPKLAAACRKIFAPSYAYSEAYREFKSKPLGQISLEDINAEK